MSHKWDNLGGCGLWARGLWARGYRPICGTNKNAKKSGHRSEDGEGGVLKKINSG
jgi:hypothetical protein